MNFRYTMFVRSLTKEVSRTDRSFFQCEGFQFCACLNGTTPCYFAGQCSNSTCNDPPPRPTQCATDSGALGCRCPCQAQDQFDYLEACRFCNTNTTRLMNRVVVLFSALCREIRASLTKRVSFAVSVFAAVVVEEDVLGTCRRGFRQYHATIANQESEHHGNVVNAG